MSQAVLDKGLYFSSPMTDWYRGRPFKVAFALSVVIHAALITFIPGFRAVPMEAPRVLDVDIVPIPATVTPTILEKPVLPPKFVEPRIEAVPEPVTRQPQPEPTPEPILRPPQPEPPPVPLTEIIRAPRVEPRPEFVVPKPVLRPEPEAEPRLEYKPEPKFEVRPEPPPLAHVEPRPEPPAVVRVNPRPEPRPVPIVEPRPEPRIEPRAEPRPEVKPRPRETPTPVQPRVEPSVAAPAVPTPVRPPAPIAAAAPATPAVAPQPQATDAGLESALTARYQQIISAKIKQYEEYPPVAKRRHWEGTTVVRLRLAPDGRVTEIFVVEKSGYEILDDAAVRMIRKASPLPLPPEGLRGRDQTVLVPIKFRLES